METIPALIATAAGARLGQPALWRWLDARFEPVTYGQLLAAVDCIAAELRRNDVGPGGRVAIAVTDRFCWGITFLGVLFSGATAVPIDPLLTPTEIAAILNDADVAAVIRDDRIDIGQPTVDPKIIPLETVWPGFGETDDPKPVVLPDITRDSLASIIYTSGTTGRAKGVMLSHGNLVSDIRGITEMGLCCGRDRLLSILPIHHAFECTAGFLYPLTIGAQVAYARSLKSRDIMADLRATRATVILGVPLLFENIVNAIKRKVAAASRRRQAMFNTLLGLSRGARRIGNRGLGRRLFASLRRQAGLDSLRLLVSGGAALPAAVAEFCDTIGLPLVQGYGLTETSPVVAVNRPDSYRYDTVGPPIPSARIKVLNPDADGRGEIAVAGPMVMQGYWRRPEETVAVLRDGWLRTGDLGVIEADGQLRICGRSKNVIISGAGKNVYPEEVETIINARPEISESVVYGYSRPGRIGETVAAVVVADPDWFADCNPDAWADDALLADVLSVAVDEACRQLAPFKRVTRVRIRRQPFERTSTRKIKRYLVIPNEGEMPGSMGTGP